MGQKMKNAPVYFTIAQVRFNAVTSIDTYVPAIQEALRRAGYPDYKESSLASIAFAFGNNEQAQVNQTQQRRFTFANMEGSGGFLLDVNSLSLQATEYDVFDLFSAELMKGLDIVNQSIPGGIAFSERVGLRYLDAVFPGQGDALAQYLIPEVIGLSEKLKGVLAHSFAETVIQTGDNTVIARAIVQDGPIAFPSDLNPLSMLKVAERFTTLSGRHAILDTDASYSVRQSFDLAGLRARLSSLNDCASEVFKATTTPYAKEQWA